MTDGTVHVVVVVVVCAMSLAVISLSVAVFLANRSRDRVFARAQAELVDLAHQLCKESMDRVLAATDLAAYYKVCDVERERKPKEVHPVRVREI